MTNARAPRLHDSPANRPAGPSGRLLGDAAVRSITSEALMAGQRMILIRHGNEEYRLQVTGSGKLILTK
jgi:hemin uptake protein HemP